MIALAPKMGWQVSHIVPIAYALTIVATTIAGSILLGETLTLKKMAAVALMAGGTLFLVNDA